MNKKAFTLIELIVVIAIIGFLGMVGVMTFMQWFSKSRDASRIAALQNMAMALEVNLVRSTKYPEPDDYVQIQYSGGVLSYQGKFGEQVANSLPEIKKVPKDPKDKIYYTYTVSANRKNYGLLAMLEGEQEPITYNPFIQEVYAVNTGDYAKRYPYHIGEIAVLLKQDNTPIENDKNLVSSGLNLATSTDVYRIVKKDGEVEEKQGSEINEEDLGTEVKQSVDGVCGTRVYKCNKGEVIDKGQNDTQYTWKCKGENGGITADCSKSKVDIFGDNSGIALYEFEGNANDAGGSYNGSWNGNEQYDNGKIGQAAKFDGSSYVRISNMLKNTRTVSFWLKQNTPINNKATIFHFSNDYNNTFVFWQYHSNNKQLIISINNTHYNSNVGYYDNLFHFYTFVIGSSNVKMYIDGELKKTFNAVPNMNSINKDVLIGADWDPNNVINDLIQADTVIDNFRLFNRALTDAEVQYLYNLENQ